MSPTCAVRWPGSRRGHVVRTRPPDTSPTSHRPRSTPVVSRIVLASGRSSAAAGRPEEAADLLAEALGLWRGPDALEGLGQSFARIEARRLAELRLIGRRSSASPRIWNWAAGRTSRPCVAHVAAHPLRERPRGQLMTALYRTGRVPDALRCTRRAARSSGGAGHRSRAPAAVTAPGGADQGDTKLSGTVGPREHGSGTGDAPEEAAPRRAAPVPTVSGAPARPAPSHLPPDIADFVGRYRADRLGRLAAGQGRGDRPHRLADRSGLRPVGTGKTALAVHVGHRIVRPLPGRAPVRGPARRGHRSAAVRRRPRQTAARHGCRPRDPADLESRS